MPGPNRQAYHQAMKTAGEDALKPTGHDVLKAYADALILAEPFQMELLKAYGVSLMQFRILRILQRGGPKVAGRLAEAAGIQPASLSRVLDRLEAEGLVGRCPDAADRRRVEVRLTERAEQLLTHRPWLGTPFEAASEAMDGSQRRAFIESVRTFVETVRNHTVAEPETPVEP